MEEGTKKKIRGRDGEGIRGCGVWFIMTIGSWTK